MRKLLSATVLISLLMLLTQSLMAQGPQKAPDSPLAVNAVAIDVPQDGCPVSGWNKAELADTPRIMTEPDYHFQTTSGVVAVNIPVKGFKQGFPPKGLWGRYIVFETEQYTTLPYALTPGCNFIQVDQPGEAINAKWRLMRWQKVNGQYKLKVFKRGHLTAEGLRPEFECFNLHDAYYSQYTLGSGKIGYTVVFEYEAAYNHEEVYIYFGDPETGALPVSVNWSAAIPYAFGFNAAYHIMFTQPPDHLWVECYSSSGELLRSVDMPLDQSDRLMTDNGLIALPATPETKDLRGN